MTTFIIRFLFCNIFISVIVGILFTAKWLFKNSLSARMQYHLWFLFLVLLAVPFLPVRPIKFLSISSWVERFKNISVLNDSTVETATLFHPSDASNWMNDFSLSVSRETPSTTGLILCVVWMTGVLIMTAFVIKSNIRLYQLKQSALPLQNPQVHALYADCLKELQITRNIPVYTTAFLKSPMLAGLFRPRIYLPIHVISDYPATNLRYILLHELQHYKHKDNLGGYFMNLAGILYWFNPLVWHALKKMLNDREIACDTSVLKMLDENDYEDYGNTLINFAEKVSLTPFPFATGISGTMKQMKRRIVNIASYEKPSVLKRLKGIAAFGMTAVLLLSLTPILSTYAADDCHYQWNTSKKNISYMDCSAYFDGYNGSFVLYDLENDFWSIYDMDHATMRVAPDSTYKIYDALFGLEESIITPKNSLITWDKEEYPFEEWNADQTLHSAMQSSVNWYFQAIDQQLGADSIKKYIQEIGYGNENISGNLSSYWLESTLKISPIEQVELLKKLYCNDFGFSLENVNTVKESICLSSTPNGTIYGKTGTGRVNEQDVNGWFVGCVENSGHTYFFAANIQADEEASGSKASEIALSILSDWNVWK